jgi:hypothetical protein
MNELALSFITIDRNEIYINDSVNSCLKNSTVPVKINVYCGCEDTSFIIVKDKIHHLSCLSDQRYPKTKPLINQTVNYIKALLDTQLIFEDDIIFQHKWNERFQEIYDELKNTQKFFISLHNHNDCHSYFEGKKYLIYNENKKASGPCQTIFGCSQGIYYPNLYGIKFASYLMENIGKNHVDNSLGLFSEQNNYKIYYTTKSIIQHVGKVSTRLSIQSKF